MAVLSPPGRIRAAHEESSAGVRTWMNFKGLEARVGVRVAARSSSEMCSTKAPWRASTPIVRDADADAASLLLLALAGCMM